MVQIVINHDGILYTELYNNFIKGKKPKDED